MAGVCGRDCQNCTYRAETGCRGCLETEGRPFYGDCQVVRCCHGRGKQNCGECKDQADCGWAEAMARKREVWGQEEEERQRRREAERLAREADLRRRAPVFAQWLPVLFWAAIISMAASLLGKLNLSWGMQAGLDTVGVLTGLVGLFIYWKFSRLSHRFWSVWILELIAEALALLSLALLFGSGAAQAARAGTLEELSGPAVLALLLVLPTIGVGIASIYQFCEAMAEQTEDLLPELGEKWRKLRRWTMGALGIVLGCLLVVFMTPVLGALLGLGGALLLLGCSIAELVLLWRSACCFRELAATIPAAPE